jgi:GTP-binding protein YchF
VEVSLRTGILGYPQSGKTTLFNVLARAHAPTGAYASAAGGINVGTVEVPDPRLEALRDMFHPKKYTPARIEFVDLAGNAVSGRERGGALLPQQITSSDLILVVVRAFEDPAVPHPRGSVDPMRDLTGFLDELALTDMAVLEGRLERVRKAKKVGAKHDAEEIPVLERCLASLEDGVPLRELELSAEHDRLLRGYQLLTAKPLLAVFNVGDDRARGAGLAGRVEKRPGTAALEICGKAEMEIAELGEAEAREFMELLGIAESGLDQVIRRSYELLGLQPFFTVGEDEVRAWTIARGTRAQQAAGKIHSDLERGFIRAEVVAAQDLLEAGGLAEAKARNLLKVEGKDYVVRDGDVLNIRFSV